MTISRFEEMIWGRVQEGRLARLRGEPRAAPDPIFQMDWELGWDNQDAELKREAERAAVNEQGYALDEREHRPMVAL